MITKTINLYSFSELSDKAKDMARNWYREASSCDNFWSELTIWEAKEQGLNMGLDIEKVYREGFFNQGSGACFTGTWSASGVMADKVADGWGESNDGSTKEIKRIAGEFKAFAEKYPESSFRVSHSGHYYHEYCTNFTVSLGEDMDNDPDKITQTEWSAAEDSLIKIARDYMRWIHKQLEKEYDYQNSDDFVEECILANEYTFKIDGTRED